MPDKSLVKTSAAYALIIIAGFAAVFALSNYLSSVRPPMPEGWEDQDLALQGAKLKNYSLGFDGLIADWYWMQSLQYIGEKLVKTQEDISLDNLRPLNPRLLYPLLDNATTLDPQFMVAYSYGAVVLPAIDPELAIRITEKGIASNPQHWRLYQHLGYIYWRLGNYEKAAEAYEKGSQIPGAGGFMRMMVARMKTEGGSRGTARAMYEQMFNDAEDSQTRENAAIRLLELDSLDERDAIRSVLAAFSEKNGRCASSWRELSPALRGVRTASGRPIRFEPSGPAPVDPTGIPYLLLPDKCVVVVDAQASKIPAS